MAFIAFLKTEEGLINADLFQMWKNYVKFILPEFHVWNVVLLPLGQFDRAQWL